MRVGASPSKHGLQVQGRQRVSPVGEVAELGALKAGCRASSDGQHGEEMLHQLTEVVVPKTRKGTHARTRACTHTHTHTLKNQFNL